MSGDLNPEAGYNAEINPSANPSAELPRKQLSLARMVLNYEDLPRPFAV